MKVIVLSILVLINFYCAVNAAILQSNNENLSIDEPEQDPIEQDLLEIKIEHEANNQEVQPSHVFNFAQPSQLYFGNVYNNHTTMNVNIFNIHLDKQNSTGEETSELIKRIQQAISNLQPISSP